MKLNFKLLIGASIIALIIFAVINILPRPIAGITDEIADLEKRFLDIEDTELDLSYLSELETWFNETESVLADPKVADVRDIDTVTIPDFEADFEETVIMDLE